MTILYVCIAEAGSGIIGLAGGIVVSRSFLSQFLAQSGIFGVSADGK